MRRPLYVAVLVFLSLALMAQSFPTNTFDKGSSSAPSRAYRDDYQLGSYRIMPSNEGFASDGRLRWHWSASLMHLTSGLDLRVGGGGFFQSAVGIGTNDPTSALHVVGSVALTGTLATQNGLALGSVSTPSQTLHVGGTATISGASTLLSSLTLANAAQVLTPLGTAAVPAVAPSAETGNGLYRNAASRMGFSQGLHVTGGLHVQAGFALGAHMVTIASGAGVEILAGHRAVTLIDCNASGGCELQLSTFDVAPGAMTRIINVSTSAQPVTITSVAGSQHVFSLFTMAVNHSIGFMYVTNRSGQSIWVEQWRNGRAQ